MKEDLTTTADEASDDRKHADRAEADEDFMIEMDTKIDRCCFLFLFLFCIS